MKKSRYLQGRKKQYIFGRKQKIKAKGYLILRITYRF
jgi:hypothetical protein